MKVANAFVNSRLDYCNSQLYHTKKAYTVRLQRVQNVLCFIVYNRLSIFSSKPNKCSGLYSFAVAAPIEWNKLPQAIRIVEVSLDS